MHNRIRYRLASAFFWSVVAASSSAAADFSDSGAWAPELLAVAAAPADSAIEPVQVDPPFRQQGAGSWYGKRFHGKRTASGERFNMHAMTAAHRTLPFNSYVRVTNLANGRQVVVRINDRGPRLRGRIIDLSYAAARALGFTKKGLARLRIETLRPDQVEEYAIGKT